MRKCVIGILLLILFGIVYSQGWSIRISISPRPSPYIEEWRRNPSMASLVIRNNNSTPQKVTLYVTIDHSSHGRVLTGESRVISFAPFESKVIDNPEMVDWSTVKYPKYLKNLALRTGLLPTGHYKLCVNIRKGKTTVAHQCVDFGIVLPSPPMLLSPRNGDTLTGMPVFRWTPVRAPSFLGVEYEISIWQVRPLEDPALALKRKPFVQRTVRSTMFSYSSRLPTLTPGKAYIWMVRAVDRDGNPVGANHGKSEVWGFWYGYRRLTLLPHKLKMAGFLINVTTYTPGSSLSSLSGEGKSFFIDSRGDTIFFDLEFENLSARFLGGDSGKVYTGEISVNFSTPLEIIKDGFTVFVNNLLMCPDSVVANLRVEAPCIFDTIGDQPWRTNGFDVKVDRYCSFHKTIPASDLKPFRVDDYPIIMIPDGELKIYMGSPHISSGGGSGGGHTPPSGGTLPSGTIIPTHGVPEESTVSHEILWSVLGGTRMVFTSGHTQQADTTPVSNIGYLLGKYNFTNAEVNDSGVDVELSLANSFRFISLAPYGIEFEIYNGKLEIKHCSFEGGYIKGQLKLPTGENGVENKDGKPITAVFDSLTIEPDFDVVGDCFLNEAMFFGKYWFKNDSLARLNLHASPSAFESPIKNDTLLNELGPTASGLSFDFRDNDDMLGIISPDTKDTIKINASINGIEGWFLFEEQGLTGKIFSSGEGGIIAETELGRPGEPDYLAKKKFKTTIKSDYRYGYPFDISFAGNSLYDAHLSGYIDTLPYPAKVYIPFKNMSLTSVAQFTSGLVHFDTAQVLAYWQLLLTCERGYAVVRTGQVAFTNADIAETLHFSRPFNIIWGEIMADGNVREFYFNHNAAYQKFDGHPITLDSAALSEYDTSATQKLGALVVKNTIHFLFFGETDTPIVIYDYYYPAKTDSPFYARYIVIDPDHFRLRREWGNGLATFDFDSVMYDTLDQNSFVGVGDAGYRYLQGGALQASMDMDSAHIRICAHTDDARNLDLDALNFAKVSNLWNCAYIEGDELKSVSIGGVLTESTGGSILSPRGGQSVMFNMSMTPTITIIELGGRITLSGVVAGLNIDAEAKFIFDRNIGYVEGELIGAIHTSAGIPLESIGLSAVGQFNFHAGTDYSFVQGQATVSLYGIDAFFTQTGASFSISGGLFFGLNVPKEKAWVLYQQEGLRFGISPSILPARLTGFYTFTDAKAGLNFILAGGEVEIYLGYGAFESFGSGANFCGSIPSVYLLGMLGVYVYGEVFLGLASVSAKAALQLVGPCPGGFEGELELRACGLWVFCTSVDLKVGATTEKGFYITI